MVPYSAVYILALVADATAAALTARAPEPATVPRVYTGEYFDQGSQDIQADGSCVSLHDAFYHNVGSISIPCTSTAPSGQKYICTIYHSTDCSPKDAIFDHVTFEVSHSSLFSRPSDEFEKKYVGGLASSVKCETVDASQSVEKGYNHPSTDYPASCLGDSCQSDGDCKNDDAGKLFCGDSTSCERSFDEGQACQRDEQCLGYCDNNQCTAQQGSDLDGFED